MLAFTEGRAREVGSLGGGATHYRVGLGGGLGEQGGREGERRVVEWAEGGGRRHGSWGTGLEAVGGGGRCGGEGRRGEVGWGRDEKSGRGKWRGRGSRGEGGRGGGEGWGGGVGGKEGIGEGMKGRGGIDWGFYMVQTGRITEEGTRGAEG